MADPRKKTQERKSRAAREAPPLAETARGTVVKRYLRCGNPRCWCRKKKAQGHGPYYYLLRTLGAGRTQTLLLAPGQVRKAQRWTRDFKRLKRVLETITQLNIELLQWEREQQPARRRTRRSRR